MICLLVEDGRLGNQLFQYNAFRTIYPTKRCLAFGFDSLRVILRQSDKKIFFVSLRSSSDFILVRLVFFVLRASLLYFLIFLSRLRLFSSITSSLDGETLVHKRISLVPAVTIFFGYFQSSSFHLSKSSHTTFLLSVLASASHDITQNKSYELINSSSSCSIFNRYFIHIRRGDYTIYPDCKPAVLPLRWIVKCMNLVRDRVSNPVFLVFSDDYYYALDFASIFSDCFCVSSDEISDFLSLTNCLGGGIMSPSTFAWWASIAIMSRNSDALFYAPNFWMGHRMNQWYPHKGLITPWINFVSVESSDY
jgi:hypothetical protein